MNEKSGTDFDNIHFRKSVCGFERSAPNLFLGFFFTAFLLVLIFPRLAPAQNRIDYEVFFKGLEDENLVKYLREISRTVALKDNPPVSEGLLTRRVQDDVPLIEKALRSRGYYGAVIQTEIDTGVQPARVVFAIVTGPVYRLKKADIEIAAPDKKPEPPPLKTLGLEPGRPAEAEPILKARSAIVRDLKNQGFPLAEAKRPEVIVDHKDKSLSVTYSVNSGPLASFGTTEIRGAATVEPSFILQQLPWQPGDTFQADLMDKARTNLLETELFNVVLFSTGDRLDSSGRLPVFLQLSERPRRTLKLGLGYTTDEKVIGKANWEYRNLFHRGESLELLGEASGIGLLLGSSFEKPAFFRSDQSLLLDLRLADEFPDAYTSRSITGLAQVKRELDEGVDLASGIGFIFSDIEQFGESDTFQLAYLPVTFDWDRRNDILDPVRGGNLGITAAPYYDFFGGETSFIKGSARYSHYLKLFSSPRILLALRGTLGLISGAELEEIPADVRFYAGGGGSVRGYAYQTVGPLIGDEPLGGRSLLTVSSEIRIRITDSIGLVPFLDGGNVFESEYPDFERDLLWGAGLGLRYFTPIGPLRLDLAFPLDRRDTDDSFQFYISIGQAF